MSAIKLSNICKKYDRSVLNDFNLNVEKGEFLIVSGKSDSGKTTLLNIIGLLEKPDSGMIEILGVKNPSLGKKNGRMLIKDHIGYLFQNFALVENYTAKQNLDITCKICKTNFYDNNVQSILNDLGIQKVMNKKVYKLSGGEQQRVALARLFIKKPDILLADEPTASLDPENANIVLESISKLNRNGTTVILVTHNPEILQKASRNIVLG